MIPAICFYTFYISARDTLVTFDDACPTSSESSVYHIFQLPSNSFVHECGGGIHNSDSYFLRSKAKTRAVSVQSNRAKKSTHNEPAYENVKLSPLPSASVINTQDNVAYGHTRTSTRGAGATQNVPIYQNDIGPLPLVNTQNNVAYGHTKTITGAMQETPIYEDVTSPSPLVSTIDT